MVAGIQPNYRFILIAIGLIVLIWYCFFNTPKVVVDINKLHGITEETTVIIKVRKVQVEVFYEVLCPDSRHFVLDQVVSAWNSLDAIMDVKFLPFGKATYKKDDQDKNGWQFTCQHGKNECIGNMIHACANLHVKDSSKLVKYIACMIQNNREPKKIGESCAKSLEIEWEPIEKCSDSTEGAFFCSNRLSDVFLCIMYFYRQLFKNLINICILLGGNLLAKYGEATNNLKPAVNFIPTVVVDGSQDNQKGLLKNLLKFVCKAYEGPDKPKHCDSE